jgi:hypothetical protein
MVLPRGIPSSNPRVSGVSYPSVACRCQAMSEGEFNGNEEPHQSF